MSLLKKGLPVLGAILAVLAFFCGLCLPSVCFLRRTYLNGCDTAFGGLFKRLPTRADFSFLNCLTYVFLLVGIVCTILSFDDGNTLFSWGALVVFAAAGIFFFLTPIFAKMNMPIQPKLGIGSIISGVFSLVAAACSLAPIIFKNS